MLTMVFRPASVRPVFHKLQHNYLELTTSPSYVTTCEWLVCTVLTIHRSLVTNDRCTILYGSHGYEITAQLSVIASLCV